MMLICRSATVFQNIKATREFTHLQIIIIHFISMVISIFIIYMYHQLHYCNCYCHSRHFYPNRTVFTYLITIYVFTEGFSSELFSVKGVCSFETPRTFHAQQSYKKNFIINIRCLNYSRSKFSNVLDWVSIWNQVLINF